MAVSETPPFWFEKPGLKAWVLWPFSWLYSRAAGLKMHAKPSGFVDVPVFCVGNFVAGGAGKTPTVLAMGKAALERGLKPGFLSRGYGGRISGPDLVNLKKHNAHDVGDEPLLLARVAPTVISANRFTGAQKLIDAGCDFIIMDDGFQNPRLGKDYCLVVVDSRRGIGNGFAMPAGPLRVEISQQLQLADSVLVIGKDDGAASIIRKTARSARPVHQAALVTNNPELWQGKWLGAFAGIADPEKFFTSLRTLGADLAFIKPFSDHHFYNEQDVNDILDRAKLMKAEIVTTAKDFVRLMGVGKVQTKLAKKLKVVNVELVFEDNRIPDLLIEKSIQRFDQRMLTKEIIEQEKSAS